MTEQFYIPKTQKGIFGNVAALVIGLIVFIILIAASLWVLGVFTSNVKGAGDARKFRNSGVNRIQSQARFEGLATDYDGAIENIKSYGSPSTPQEHTELRGLQQHCVNVAQEFNAASRTYTARGWKSAGLPETLDASACNQER